MFKGAGTINSTFISVIYLPDIPCIFWAAKRAFSYPFGKIVRKSKKNWGKGGWRKNLLSHVAGIVGRTTANGHGAHGLLSSNLPETIHIWLQFLWPV